MLQINDLTFDAWGRRFFDHASVSLPVGAKVGLVGRNGVGKSTLFKLVLDELHAGDGEIGYPKTARISSVDQEHPATPISLLDTVLAADEERERLTNELETAEPEHLGEFLGHAPLMLTPQRVGKDAALAAWAIGLNLYRRVQHLVGAFDAPVDFGCGWMTVKTQRIERCQAG